MTSCDFVLPERSRHFNKVEMPFIYNACDRGRKKQMMLGVPSVPPGWNKRVCVAPLREKHTPSCSLGSSAASEAPRSKVDGVRNELLAAGDSGTAGEAKQHTSGFRGDGLLTHWTNVTGNTCKREAEGEAL